MWGHHNARSARLVWVGLVVAGLQAANLLGANAHPLDPLSREEIAAAVAALRTAGDIDATTRFALIDLAEPDKSVVLDWRRGQAAARRVFVVARRRRAVYEGVVDLGTRKVERWDAVENVQSALLPDELRTAERVVTADPGWRAAMRRRGYDPARVTVHCVPLAAGPPADLTEADRRLVRVVCFDTSGTGNVWARPIEGLYATVDLDAEKVVRLVDTGPVPVSHDPGRIGPQPPPGAVTAPSSRSWNFAVADNAVHWRRWSFRYRLDPRTGLVVSVVRYDDNGRRRLVLYRGSLSEMFVPYMDADPGWSFRNYMDVGEYGIGALSLPLTRGSDCPASARFLDAVLADEFGEPHRRHGVICVFERDTAQPLWRHAETATGAYAGRPATELVLRTIPTIGDYDYVIDWVLTEAGAIRIDVGATGIDQVKGVPAQTMADPSAARDTAAGNLVAPGLVGVDHDHFLSFRLDVDIDGQPNTLVRQHLVSERADSGAGSRSLWRLVDELVTIEGPIAPDGHGGDELWRIENPNATNRLGQHPAYELRPGHSAVSLLTADDPAQRRAGFAAAPLWVTAYNPNELYAAGPYPNQSAGGDGLPAYVARRRPVANADIVLWYTMGFHHVPRPEDWPVMPTMWHSVSLVPYGFFDHNPTIPGSRAAGK